jgi:hypothetical protein
MSQLQRSLPVLAALALLAAGCGGGGDSNTSGDADSGAGGASTTSNAYQAGFETCSGGTVEEIAALYGVAESTPEAVAEVIAEQLSGGSGEHASTKQGCIDAFAKSS